MNLKRSDFIKLGSMTAVGSIAIPTLLNSCTSSTTTGSSSVAACAGSGIDHEQRIKDLGLVLPPAAKPGRFKPILVSGNLLYVSGQGPDLPDGTKILGKVGSDLTLEEGQEAARQVALATLAVIKEYFGDLNKICRLVKTLGMVNCLPDFPSTHLVINGFSNLLVDVFGEEHGLGVRSAVGMVTLPGDIAVEVETIFELK